MIDKLQQLINEAFFVNIDSNTEKEVQMYEMYKLDK